MSTERELVDAAETILRAIPGELDDGTEAIQALMGASMMIIRGGGPEALAWYRSALIAALEVVDEAMAAAELAAGGVDVRLPTILAVAVAALRVRGGGPAVQLRVDVAGAESINGAIDVETAGWLARALDTVLADLAGPRPGRAA